MPIQQGMSQQTPAVQSLLRGAFGAARKAVAGSVRKSLKKSLGAASSSKKRAKPKLKFGSPAYRAKYLKPRKKAAKKK